MCGDYVKGCGAYHFYPSVWLSVRQYASEEMRAIHSVVSARRMFIHLNLTTTNPKNTYHNRPKAFIMTGSWLVGLVARSSGWCGWDRRPL